MTAAYYNRDACLGLLVVIGICFLIGFIFRDR